MFVIIACISITIITVHEAISSITVLDKGVLPIEKGSTSIQFYVNVENLNHLASCRIHSWPKICCLNNEPFKDCYTESVYGDNIEILMPHRTDTLIYVYPTLYPHDQLGYCDFVVNYRCGRHIAKSEQLIVNIPFNTEMTNLKRTEYLQAYSNDDISECDSLDQDSLKNCAPVNCDLKYDGRRPFYEASSNKCVSAPECDTDLDKEMPDTAYVPISNTCRDLEQPLTLGDIYGISTGLNVVTNKRREIMPVLKACVVSNCSTISENLILLRDLMTGKLCPLFTGDTTDYSVCCKNAVFSICACVVTISALLLGIIFFMHVAVYLYNKWVLDELHFPWKLNKSPKEDLSPVASELSSDLTSNLLKEVIVRDLPLELRDSVVDLCDRINRDVKKKRRYRMLDLGSQINLMEEVSDSSSGRRKQHYDK